jgi:anti-sigma factor RsiW
MSDIKNDNLSCARAEDLVSVLYGEAGESERRDFEVHLKRCASCRAEFNAFTQVRQAVGEWRDEALTGFVSSPAATAPVKKSAGAALRQFFGLSPLWLKGAVGFAAVIFCVLVALAFVRLNANKNTIAGGNQAGGGYSQQDVDRMVKDALAKQERELAAMAPKPVVLEPPVRALFAAKNSNTPKPTRLSKAARPFSKAEREQLASDLRLISGEDDLDLLGDRINKQ